MTQDMMTLGFDQMIRQLQDQAVSRAAGRRLGETHTMDRKFDPDAVIIVKEGKKED